MYFKSDYIIHLYRFSLRVLKYIQLQRIRHIDTSLASLMQDMVYHHLSMSGEKILQNQVNEPNLHVEKIIVLYLTQ
jgi:hypothetical protein